MAHDFDFSTAAAETDLDRGRVILEYLASAGYAVLYVREHGRFYLSRGTAWIAQDDDDMLAVTNTLHDGIEAVARERAALAMRQWDGTGPAPSTAPSTALQRTARAFGSTTTARHALAQARVQPGVPAHLDDFDADPDLLGVRNGVVNLRTGALRPYTAADRISRVVDIDFDPAAECPRWLDFLSEILVDSEGRTDLALVEFVRRLIGYGITGHTSEQRLPLLVGGGGNGKGTFIGTLTALFSSHTATAAFETFEERSRDKATFDLARLHGARLVFASEGSEGAPMAEAVLKRVTGGDRITARHPYGRDFEFTPSFLLLLSTNHLPTWATDDAAVWRRVLLVPFLAHFTEETKDKDLPERLREEFPGILAWAVRGAVEWASDGLAVPDAVTAATTTYREESHPLADWLADSVEVTGDRMNDVKRTDLREDYLSWISHNGTTDIGYRKFGRLLGETAGVVEIQKHKTSYFRGIRLLTPAERTARARGTERGLPVAA